MHASLYTGCIQCLRRLEEGVKCPGTNVTGGSGYCVGAGNQTDSNLGSSEEQSMFLSADPYLYLPFITHTVCYVAHSDLELVIILS